MQFVAHWIILELKSFVRAFHHVFYGFYWFVSVIMWPRIEVKGLSLNVFISSAIAEQKPKKRIIWISSRIHVNSRSHNLNQECDISGVRISVFFFTSISIECLAIRCSYCSSTFPSWPELFTCFACLMLSNLFVMQFMHDLQFHGVMRRESL